MRPFLVADGVSKRFPGVLALDDVHLDVRAGEVHALIGENGAGKSTLVRLLAGIQRPDTGTMTVDGQPYTPTRAADAFTVGVRVVHQELTLLPYLSVAENLLLHRLPRRAGVLVDRRRLRARSVELLEQVGLDISPSTRVERLGVAQMQLVEIAKGLAGDCRLLVLDEPTASLTPRETRTLHGIIATLVERGVGVLYISHHLDDVFEVSDRVTILRNGANVVTADTADLTVADAVRQMVGRDLAHEYPPHHGGTPGRVLLEAEDLQVPGAPGPVSLQVRAGEVVGVAGLVGAGRTELVRTLFGADRPAGGRVLVEGRAMPARHPRDAVKRGVSLLTEDRKAQGLLLPARIDVNISLASLRRVSSRGLLRRAAERSLADDLARRLRLKAPSTAVAARALSGGNQQKVVLAKWLLRDSQVLILDEPTRGIDVGARYEIHDLIGELARQGKAVLVVSSDLPELIGISDRIIVLSRGRITGELARADFDSERILNLAYAGFREASPASGPPSTPTASRSEAPA